MRIVIQQLKTALQGELLAVFQDLKGSAKKRLSARVWSIGEDKGEWLYTERGLIWIG